MSARKRYEEVTLGFLMKFNITSSNRSVPNVHGVSRTVSHLWSGSCRSGVVSLRSIGWNLEGSEEEAFDLLRTGVNVFSVEAAVLGSIGEGDIVVSSDSFDLMCPSVD
jgi:hypothetical protein